MSKLKTDLDLYINEIKTSIISGVDEPFAVLLQLVKDYLQVRPSKIFARHLKKNLESKSFLDLDPFVLNEMEIYLAPPIKRDEFFALLLAYFHVYKDCYQVYFQLNKQAYPKLYKNLFLPLEKFALNHKYQTLNQMLSTNSKINWESHIIEVALREMSTKTTLTAEDELVLKSIIDNIGTWIFDENKLPLLTAINIPAHLLKVLYKNIVDTIPAFRTELRDDLYALFLKIYLSDTSIIKVEALLQSNSDILNLVGFKFIQSLINLDHADIDTLNEKIAQGSFQFPAARYLATHAFFHRLRLSSACPQALRLSHFETLIKDLKQPMTIQAQSHLIDAFKEAEPPEHLRKQLIDNLTANPNIYYQNLNEAYGITATLVLPASFKPILFNRARTLTQMPNQFQGDTIKYLLNYKAICTPPQLRTLAEDILNHNLWRKEVLKTVISLCEHPDNRKWLLAKFMQNANLFNNAIRKQACMLLKEITIDDDNRASMVTFLFATMTSTDSNLVAKACLAFNNASLITEENRRSVINKLLECIATQGDHAIKLKIYSVLATIDRGSPEPIFDCQDLLDRINNLTISDDAYTPLLYEMLSRTPVPAHLCIPVLERVIKSAHMVKVADFMRIVSKQPLPESYQDSIIKLCLYYLDQKSYYQYTPMKQAAGDFASLYEFIETIPRSKEFNYQMLSLIIDDYYNQKLNFTKLFAMLPIPQNKMEGVCIKLIRLLSQASEGRDSTAWLTCLEMLFQRLDVLQQNTLLIKLQYQADTRNNPNLAVFANYLRINYLNFETMKIAIGQKCEPKLPPEIWENVQRHTYTC